MENTTIIQKLQAKKNKKGFTLVELVIVIAILAILAAIAIPVVISTINSADVSTFKSDTATVEMLLKAAINEQKGKVGTVYSPEGTAAASIVKADGTQDIQFKLVAEKNGYNGSYTKTTSDGTYSMYYVNKKYLVPATAVPSGEIDINGTKVTVDGTPVLVNGDTYIQKNGDVSDSATS